MHYIHISKQIYVGHIFWPRNPFYISILALPDTACYTTNCQEKCDAHSTNICVKSVFHHAPAAAPGTCLLYQYITANIDGVVYYLIHQEAWITKQYRPRFCEAVFRRTYFLYRIGAKINVFHIIFRSSWSPWNPFDKNYFKKKSGKFFSRLILSRISTELHLIDCWQRWPPVIISDED